MQPCEGGTATVPYTRRETGEEEGSPAWDPTTTTAEGFSWSDPEPGWEGSSLPPFVFLPGLEGPDVPWLV